MENKLLKNKEFLNILKKIKLKKLVYGIGHDKAGYSCDLYIGNTMIAYINDDGRGGEIEIYYENEKAKQLIKEFLEKHDIKTLMFENGWEFIKDKEKIDRTSQIAIIVEELINLKEDEKYKKKIKKHTENGIVYGNDNGFKVTVFRIKLKEMVLIKDGMMFLQKKYDEIKANLKDNEKILNENLEELGIKL